jgi:ankyrin repeat protein
MIYYLKIECYQRIGTFESKHAKWAAKHDAVSILGFLCARNRSHPKVVESALRNGSLRVAEFLGSFQDVDLTDGSVLFRVISMKSADFFKGLAGNAEFDVNAQNKFGQSLLMAAIAEHQPDIAVWLLDRFGAKINVNILSNAGRTAALLAMADGLWEVLRKILEHPKFDFFSDSFNANECIVVCARMNNFSGMRRIAESGRPIDIVHRDCKGHEAIDYACKHRNFEMIRYLLDFPQVSLPQSFLGPSTPRKKKKGILDPDILEIALRHRKIGPATRLTGGRACLTVAVEKNHEGLFDLILTDPDADVNGGYPPALVVAITKNKHKMFQRLLKHPRIDLGTTSNPIMAAIKSEDPFFFNLLMQHPNVSLLKPNTIEAPLMAAIKAGKPDYVKKLLEIPGAGVGTTFERASKRTPFQVANNELRKNPTSQAHNDIVQIIAEHGASDVGWAAPHRKQPESQSTDSKNPLTKRCWTQPAEAAVRWADPSNKNQPTFGLAGSTSWRQAETAPQAGVGAPHFGNGAISQRGCQDNKSTPVQMPPPPKQPGAAPSWGATRAAGNPWSGKGRGEPLLASEGAPAARGRDEGWSWVQLSDQSPTNYGAAAITPTSPRPVQTASDEGISKNDRTAVQIGGRKDAGHSQAPKNEEPATAWPAWPRAARGGSDGAAEQRAKSSFGTDRVSHEREEVVWPTLAHTEKAGFRIDTQSP